MPEAAVAVTPAAAPPPPAPPPAASPPPVQAAGTPPPVVAAPNGQQAETAPALELKLPAGAEKRFDPKALEKLKGIMGDDVKKTQAIIDMQHQAMIAEEKAITEQAEKMRTADLEALKGDPAFGGAKFDRTVADAKSALQQFGGEEVSKLFTALGVDKHPGLTKMFARIRSAIAEDDTSSRAPKPVPDEPKTRPQTQTQRLAKRYDKKK